MGRARHGIIYLKKDGNILQAEGDFEFNFGIPKNEPMHGSGGKVVATKQTAQSPFIKGNIIIQKETNIESIVNTRDSVITLEMTDLTVVLTNAEFMGEGTVNTGDGKLPVEFFGEDLKSI